MSNYVIFTDSACDITPEVLKEWGVRCVSLAFRFDHIDQDFLNEDMPIKEFYQNMRDGHVAKTNAVNAETFRENFEPVLAEGTDILYLGFSSGLSTTFQQGKLAAEDLAEKYPDRKIIAIDTLCASAGEGLIVKLVLDKKNEGATIEEAAAYAGALIPKLAHWFTVEDLVYLKRGGRVSPTVALAGTLLGIKPVIAVEDGEVAILGKARGSKNGNNMLMTLVEKSGGINFDLPYCLAYTGLSDALLQKYIADSASLYVGKAEKLPVYTIGSTIGTHAGPGAIAVAFFGNN